MRRLKKKKGIKGEREKDPTPTWATDALIGEEEHKRKEKKKKERGSGPPIQLH